MKIEVKVVIGSDLDSVWLAWSTPEDIKQWNAASAAWHTTASEVDLQVGGLFSSRMEAKDGSMGFDFSGRFTRIVAKQLIEYVLDDGRTVAVTFTPVTGGIEVRESFEAEAANSIEQQRVGWQSILDNFARYVEEK